MSTRKKEKEKMKKEKGHTWFWLEKKKKKKKKQKQRRLSWDYYQYRDNKEEKKKKKKKRREVEIITIKLWKGWSLKIDNESLEKWKLHESKKWGSILSFFLNKCFHACFLFISGKQVLSGLGWKIPEPHLKNFFPPTLLPPSLPNNTNLFSFHYFPSILFQPQPNIP